MNITPTLTEHGQALRKVARSTELGPYLFLLLEADRPLAGGDRYALEGVDRVVLGRGDARAAAREGKQLTVRVPDPRMSTSHAKLERVFDRWVVEDTRSKNGVRVNGQTVERSPLADGDLLESGHTFFVFREGLPVVPEETSAGAELQTLLPALALAFDELTRVARSKLPVLILGETGTGKELAARAVHRLSERAGPFTAVNCGAIAEGLLESELFGYRKGAFSGANEDRPGLLRSSDRGTLFLDEVGELPLRSQPALLRALQEEEVQPVGGTSAVAVNLRVVSATHRDVEAQSQQGKFREDLLARLNGYVLQLPPLRERKEDLGLLIAALLPRVSGDAKPKRGLSLEAVRALYRYKWPRNVRELEKALASAVVLGKGDLLELEDLPEPVRTQRADRTTDATPSAVPEEALTEKDRAIRDEVAQQLAEHGGNLSAVARAMGKDRKQIHRWVKRFGLKSGTEEG